MAWAKNGTPDTLSGTADVMTISDLTAYKFNQFLVHTIGDAPTVTSFDHKYTIDNNSATDYAYRSSTNGAADATGTSKQFILTTNHDTTDLEIIYSINIDSEEKLFIISSIEQGTAGASSAPTRRELVAKEDATTNTAQYTRLDLNNSVASVSFDTGSNMSVLGTD